MKTFKEYLAELSFNSKDNTKEWKNTRNDRFWDARFITSSGQNVTFRAYEQENEYWEISFLVGTDWNITGKGEVVEIFTTIYDIFKVWLKDKNPKEFSFNAKEKSRDRLYRRFAKHIEKTTKYNLDIEASGQGTEFLFDRIS